MVLLISATSAFGVAAAGEVAPRCPTPESLLDPTVVLPDIEKGESAFLVRCGLDINHAMMLEGAPVRPIDLAAADPDPRLAKQVLQAGANPNDDGGPELGVFPLDTALAAHNLATARMLLQYGARADYRQPQSGMTALIAIAFSKDARNDYEALVGTLLQHGAQIDATDNHGDSALHWAARLDNEPLVRVLLMHGAQTCRKNKKGLTPAQVIGHPKPAGLIRVLQHHCGAATPQILTPPPGTRH